MIVKLEQVSVGYHRQPILHNINLNLAEGKIFCLLGANGCGKTTLMRTLLGFLPPISGNISLIGRSLSGWLTRDLAKVIAYVPQAHDTPFSYQVIDMVVMGLTPHISLFTVPGKKAHLLAEESLCRLGISHLKQRQYCTLSGGEKQLVLIARALVQQPKLLIMDEPAASLDFGNQIRLLEQIEQLKNSGITVLMSTHHPQHAAAVADEVILLHPEFGAKQGSPESMLTLTNLSTLYRIDEQRIAAHFHSSSFSSPP